ncbi:MAG: hypothetical protein WC877_01810 [Dehalococcoidales bacterium]|jgi:hypothetical protein
MGKNFGNWEFLRMWPFKKKSIRSVSIYINVYDPDDLTSRYESYQLCVDETEYNDINDDVYNFIDDTVMKVEKWNKQKVENEERAELERLKSKYYGR